MITGETTWNSNPVTMALLLGIHCTVTSIQTNQPMYTFEVLTCWFEFHNVSDLYDPILVTLLGQLYSLKHN